MSNANQAWKKGRGKLGIFEPLMGSWMAEADSEMGKVRCTRLFTRILDGSYIQLTAHWDFGQKVYQEIAFIGVADDGEVGFWSFTSDGKHSSGQIADVSDVHPLAIGFEAQMPAGLARMAYWPDELEGFHWVVEAKTMKGWHRFTHHYYRPAH